jgi:NADH-quinone oxidoreductase subunit J
MDTVIFALFATLAIVASIVVVGHKNPVYSTLSLVVTLVAVAVLFLLLGAPFLAALQILIYAGAIVVLFLFVIMLLNLQAEERHFVPHGPQLWIAALCAAAFAALLGLFFWTTRSGALKPIPEQLVSLPHLAGKLFKDYLLPFEIVGLLLLVAVIGATVVSKRPDPLPAGAAGTSDHRPERAAAPPSQEDES